MKTRYHLKTFISQLATRSLLVLALAALTPSALLVRAQVPARAVSDGESVEVALYQSLLDLNSPWTVMCIAAHPDDEDGATLTMLRRKYGVHTVSLFSTYGEGGQNAVGPELYEELGAIRARETIEASALQGSEPYFLGLRDFGFSKSADEAFRIWGHDEALRRMVLQIRTLRPDVIITNHDTANGHGHHQATGRLALESFDAAADPARFPEQLRDGLTIWQVQRLFVRGFGRGGAGNRSTDETMQQTTGIVSIDINERDPVRKATYAEQALRALRRHATQGPWPQTLPAGGRPAIRYRLTREAKNAAPLPATAQTFLDGLRLPEQIAANLAPPTIDNRPLTEFINERARLIYALATARSVKLYEAHRAADDAPRLRLMSERRNRALAAASGINMTLTPHDAVVIPNSSTTLSLSISNQGETAVTVRGVGAGVYTGGRSPVQTPLQLEPKGSLDQTMRVSVSDNARINVPHSAHLYDGLLLGQQFDVSVEIEIKDGIRFPLTASTRVDVAPPIEIRSVEPSPLVLTPGTINRPVTLTFRVINHQRMPFEGRIGSGNAGDHVGESETFTLKPDEARNVKVTLPASMFGRLEPGAAQPSTPLGKGILRTIWPTHSSKPVAHLTTPTIYSDARVAPGLNVAYVLSSDDTLPNALTALGVKAKELTVADVRAGDLQRYDTIIIDNRGYEAHPELIAANTRLLDYVRAGGTLIVFYHKTNEWNPDPQKNRPQLAPYPITLGGARVTDEDAHVTFTEPQHALLNFPNKIGADDFKGWVQERGLYYPKDWDTHYSAPLSMNDPNEPPLRGGLLAADYERGRYIYTSMVWYRQLRAGVPGAYRVFANMISYGHVRKE